ncbi:HepT-like ribonuclease domain-containing protein [Spirosoma areae]
MSFRNRLIHGYFGVDYQILWYILQNDLTALESQLSAIAHPSE